MSVKVIAFVLLIIAVGVTGEKSSRSISKRFLDGIKDKIKGKSSKKKRKEAKERCDDKEIDFCKNGSRCQVNRKGLMRCFPCPKHLTGYQCESPLSSEEDLDRLRQIALLLDDSKFEYPCEGRQRYEYVALDCENGGTCMGGLYRDPLPGGQDVDYEAVAKCFCPPTWTGMLCENSIGGCDDKPCVHGKCSEIKRNKVAPEENPLPFVCKCSKKYTGHLCQTFLESVGQCSANCKKSAKKTKLTKVRGALKTLFRHILEAEKYAGKCVEIPKLIVLFEEIVPTTEELNTLVETVRSYQGLVFSDQGICVCYPGYMGAFCDKKCKAGRYGQFCILKCNGCLDLKCDRVTGNCKKGCIVGRQGKKCDDIATVVKCQTGKASCLNGECVRLTDTDIKCKCTKPGFTGEYCDTACSRGTYGESCRKNCSDFCRKAGACDPVTGNCPDHPEGKCTGGLFKDEDRCEGKTDASVETKFNMTFSGEGQNVEVKAITTLTEELTTAMTKNIDSGSTPVISGKVDEFNTDFYKEEAEKQLITEWDTYDFETKVEVTDEWVTYIEKVKVNDRELLDLIFKRLDELENEDPDAVFVPDTRAQQQPSLLKQLEKKYPDESNKKQTAELLKELDKKYPDDMDKDEIDAFLKELDKNYPDDMDKDEIDAFLTGRRRPVRGDHRPTDGQSKTGNHRQKRQTETLSYAATVSFPLDTSDTVNIKEEVTAATQKTAKTFKSSAIPDLQIDESSIDVSDVAVVRAADTNSSKSSGLVFTVVAFLALLIGASVAAVVGTKRKKSKEVATEKNKKKRKNKPKTVKSRQKSRTRKT